MACSRGFYGSLPSPQLQGGLTPSHTNRAGSFLASNDSAIQLQLQEIVSELKDQKAVLNYIQEQVDQTTVKVDMANRYVLSDQQLYTYGALFDCIA